MWISFLAQPWWAFFLEAFGFWMFVRLFHVDITVAGRRFRSFSDPKPRKEGDCQCGSGERPKPKATV